MDETMYQQAQETSGIPAGIDVRQPGTPAPVAIAAQEPFDFKALTSTRKMLGTIGKTVFYDGYDFKFVSNRHPHPKPGKIKWLCLHYMMTVIIPNALLGRKYGVAIPGDAPGEALTYCMTTGKSPEAVEAYWAAIGQIWPEVIEKYNLYVENRMRDGKQVAKGTEWFFDKFVGSHIKEEALDFAGKFRKGKSQDEVLKLMERMKTEPALATMTKKELIGSGIPERTAKLFMKTRSKT